MTRYVVQVFDSEREDWRREGARRSLSAARALAFDVGSLLGAEARIVDTETGEVIHLPELAEEGRG